MMSLPLIPGVSLVMKIKFLGHFITHPRSAWSWIQVYRLDARKDQKAPYYLDPSDHLAIMNGLHGHARGLVEWQAQQMEWWSQRSTVTAMRQAKSISVIALAVSVAAVLVALLSGCSTYGGQAVKVSPATTGPSAGTPAAKAAQSAEGRLDEAKSSVPFPTSFLDGTYRIPKDMKPGQYVTKGPADVDGMCYWERLSGFSGEGQDIIANGNPTGRSIVTIKKSDKGFGTSGCQAWRLIK